MIEIVQANWIVFVAALLIGLLVAWWLFARSAAPRERARTADVLDEGAAPAARNQALIDSVPPAAAFTAGIPGIVGGVEAPIAVAATAAASEPVDEAQLAEGPADRAVSGNRADDLTRIKGVGPKLVALLASLGITRFAQIAAWTDDDLDRIDGQLGAFTGRPRRDGWVEQAGYLANDDVAGFEARFGKV